MRKPIWMVRAGQDSVYVQEFLEKHIVAIGWSGIGDLSYVHDRETISALLIREFPEYRKLQNATNTGQIYRFREELIKDTLVVTYDSGARIYHVGKIAGDYAFNADNHEELRHTRPVAWFAQISRDTLTTATKNSLGSIATVFCISDAATAEIESKLNLSNETVLDVLEVLADAEEPEAESELRKDTEQRALDFLQDRLVRLNWEEMQELVAGLLRAMGYKTRVSPAGPDRGKDVIASPDGFGFQSPRIVVEVKHRKGSMGPTDVRAFAGVLRNDTSGLFVSTGGFTREARYEAERANHHVSLMDSFDLGKAIVDHYDNMDTDTRTLLPLKKIYWPA